LGTHAQQAKYKAASADKSVELGRPTMALVVPSAPPPHRGQFIFFALEIETVFGSEESWKSDDPK
jgi:hypothetical protein